MGIHWDMCSMVFTFIATLFFLKTKKVQFTLQDYNLLVLQVLVLENGFKNNKVANLRTKQLKWTNLIALLY